MYGLKVENLGLRHPGLTAKVDAMLQAVATLKAIREMIQNEYGESVGMTALWKYKMWNWNTRRTEAQAVKRAEERKRNAGLCFAQDPVAPTGTFSDAVGRPARLQAAARTCPVGPRLETNAQEP
jgi:hypothetical protein